MPDDSLTKHSAPHSCRFGPYVLDASVRELRRDGAAVEIEPRVFDLLLFLARNCDRAVSKDELLAALWPRQIVTETALTRAVMKARRAVGDDSDRQGVIKTVHGHGYRFVAALEDPEDAVAADAADAGAAEAAPSAPATSRSASVRRRATPARLAVAALLAVTVAIALFLALGRPAGPAEGGRVAVLPVSNQTGDPDLGWVRVGLMSLLARMLEEGGVDVVAERTVLAALDGVEPDKPPDRETFGAFRQRAGADSVLFTALEVRGGLHRLSAVLTHPDGRQTRRLITGASPAELAAELATIMAGILADASSPATGRFAKVSTDPFVNELYARALDLELEGRLREARETFRVAAAQEPELFWLRYEIALCTRDLREFEQAEQMFADLYAEANAGADARARIVTLNSHGVMLLMQNRYQAAEENYLDALEIASERDMASERSTILVNLALVNTRQGEVDTARGYFEEALAAHEAQGSAPSGFLLNNYAGLLLQIGDIAAARTYSERAVEVFREQGQRRFEAPSLNRLAKILRKQGDLDGAVERHSQALEIYRDLGDTGGELSVLSGLTGLYRIRGDLTRALNHGRDVLERTGSTGEPLLVADAHMQLGKVLSDTEDFAGAMPHFEQALKIYSDSGDVPGTREARANIAVTRLGAGEFDAAQELAETLHAEAVASGNESDEARANWLLGKVAHARDDEPAARERFGAALAFARASQNPETLSLAGMALAELELDENQIPDAVAVVEEIRPYAAGELDFRRLDARIAAALGDNDRASTILGELRVQAGEAWRAEDDALLRELQR